MVADEIRQLADTSTEAVTEITAITNGINGLVTDTIVKTKQSVEGIRESVNLVDGACATFEEIFANIDATSVLVGLQPSQGTGLVEIINDPDQNGVFKIKDTKQKFVVVDSNDEKKTKTVYDLSGLILEEVGV